MRRAGEKMSKKITVRGGTAELAKLIGITQRRVNQLAEDKIITRQPEGDFVLPEAIAEFYSFKFQNEEAIDYMSEKAKHEAAKRQLAEIELAKRRNEVHEAEDVEYVMTDMLVNLRSQLLGIPAKMAPILANRDKDFIDKALADEVQTRLAELSEYNPTIFIEVNADEEENS